ncbi:MAG TPA: ABC transporter ATP-binding protein [Solirubrobacteraceae bacterium]|nr:ABC transporter ATP-binding protein [Solirubrobacteraceae bacterium]
MAGLRAEQSSEPVMRVSALAKRFGERAALRDVSFELHAGELVAVVGPNGAGKTTLLSILAGVQRADAGSVELATAPPDASAPLDTSATAAAAAMIGWAPQQVAVYSRLSVRENLRLFARLEHVADPDAAVARMLEQTGLAERADERVERLSGGNRQRVNVAVALLAEPRVLALDEPSSALDPGQRARLWEFVGALAARGTSVLFSTHHLGEVRRYASRAIVLADGELLFDGAPEELMRGASEAAAAEDLEGAFLELLRARGHA